MASSVLSCSRQPSLAAGWRTRSVVSARRPATLRVCAAADAEALKTLGAAGGGVALAFSGGIAFGNVLTNQSTLKEGLEKQTAALEKQASVFNDALEKQASVFKEALEKLTVALQKQSDDYRQDSKDLRSEFKQDTNDLRNVARNSSDERAAVLAMAAQAVQALADVASNAVPLPAAARLTQQDEGVASGSDT